MSNSISWKQWSRAPNDALVVFRMLDVAEIASSGLVRCRLARTCCEGSASSVGDYSTLDTSDVIMRAPATLAARYKRTKLRKRNPDACQKRVLQMFRSLS